MRDAGFWERERLKFLARSSQLRREIHETNDDEVRVRLHGDLRTIELHVERLVEQRDRLA